MLAGALTGYLLGYRERSQETMGHKFLGMACVACTGLVLIWSMVNGLFFLLI